MAVYGSLEKWFSATALKKTFPAEIEVKPTVGIDHVTVRKYKENLEDNLAVVSRKVLNGSFQFTNYSQILVQKGINKTPRELCVPTVRDKIVLKALSHMIAEIFGDSCKTPPPQKVVESIEAAIHAGRYSRFVKLDIQHFYDSIDHEKLLKVVESKINDKRAVELIERSITKPSVALGEKANGKRKRGVPQGLSISNQLANIYLQSVDRDLGDCPGVLAVRYVDDILLLGDEKSLEKAETVAKKDFACMDLKLNEEKSYSGSLASRPFTYLGYQFTKNELQVGLKGRRKIEASLQSLLAQIRRNPADNGLWWKLNLRITGCRLVTGGTVFRQVGWLYYYSRQSNADYSARLDSLVRKIAARMDVPLRNDVKSFKRTYYLLHYHKASSYIPSIDLDWDVNEKKDFLWKKLGLDTSSLSDTQVEDVFMKVLRHEIETLEQDIGAVS